MFIRYVYPEVRAKISLPFNNFSQDFEFDYIDLVTNWYFAVL